MCNLLEQINSVMRSLQLSATGSSVMNSTRSLVILANRSMSVNNNVYCGRSTEFPSTLTRLPPEM